jgi:hypothetical protein
MNLLRDERARAFAEYSESVVTAPTVFDCELGGISSRTSRLKILSPGEHVFPWIYKEREEIRKECRIQKSLETARVFPAEFLRAERATMSVLRSSS